MIKSINSIKFYDSFVCFDLETTGMSNEKDNITEIGAVKVIEGKFVSVFSTLVNPKMHIPGFITELTGISDEMVKDKPIIEDVLPDFKGFFEDLPLVAHNSSFDCRFLFRDFEKINFYPNNTVIDTLKISRSILKNKTENFKLGTLTKYFNIPHINAHRAWCDADVTAKLYLELKKLYKEIF